MKILLAEDDENISTIAKITLEQLGGHQVELASDGEQALTMAITHTYDLVLLDEMMPKMNGLNVCRSYYEQCQSPAPVIFLSAKSQDSDIAEFNELAIGYIPKPFDPAHLCKQIDHILQIHLFKTKGKSA